MKNTISEKDGVFTLIRNGKAAVCPYRAPIVLPGQLQGQVQIMPHPCNSQCPHWSFFNEYYHNESLAQCEIKLSCGKGVLIFADVENKPDKPTDNQAKKIIL